MKNTIAVLRSSSFFVYPTFLQRAGLFLGFVALVVFAGCGPVSEKEEAAAAVGPAKIHVATARQETLRPTLEVAGVLESVPEFTAVLSTQASGQIERVGVKEGQSVKAGDEVVHLDDRTALAQLAKSTAALHEAEANLELLRRGPRSEEVDAARQNLRKAEAALKTAESKLAALKPLIDAHEIAAVKQEETAAAADEARAEMESVRANLRLLEAGTRPEAIKEAEAKCASAQADVAAQELAVKLCTIVSPLDGVITQLPARLGMAVQPQSTIATIINPAVLLAGFRIPSASLGSVHEGAAVEVVVASIDDAKASGTVERIGKVADAVTGDVEAFARVPNSEGHLRPGLACRVVVALPEVPDAIVIPVAAIANRGGEPVVTVVRDGKAHEVPVTLGVRTADLVQVVQGVASGDVVATEGGYGLPDDCPVIVEKEN